MVIQFSSVDYIRALKSVKFTDEQAELIAKETELLVANIEEQRNHLNKLEAKEPSTKGDIKELELRILKWMFSLGFTCITVISGVVYTLLKLMLTH